jgi:N4-gp56 family major capsid protein
MPVTTVTTAGTYDKGNVISRWSKKVAREYIKEEEFAPWSGKKEGSVFQSKTDLKKKRGDNITFSLVAKLSGAGVEGDDTLEGNEESLANFADTVTVNQLRHGVIRGDHEQSKTLIELLDEARFMLKMWAMEQLRDLKIARLTCPHADGVTTYAASTEGEKDAWDTAQSDRVLYGALLSNRSAGDHSAGLLNVDTTADTLNRSMISKLKRIAESADPLVRPIKIDGVRQHFVIFCNTAPHRDLKTDLDTIHATSAPREKGMTNPIWRDDDLVYGDCVIRKVPAMASLGTVGAASAAVYLIAFCGAQAVLVAWAKHLMGIRNGPEGQDYGNLKGVGIKETRGAKKAKFNDKDHGMVTGYAAAEADA